MLNKRTAKRIIKDFIAACKEKNIIFYKVIFFGSVASGKNHDSSDIDLAIVSDQFTTNFITNNRLLSPIIVSNREFYAIETHTFPTAYFEQGDPFIEEIKKTGIEIKV